MLFGVLGLLLLHTMYALMDPVSFFICMAIAGVYYCVRNFLYGSV